MRQEGHLERMAAALQGPTLVRKGPQDGISHGGRTIHCATGGSKRRAGGQVSAHLFLLTTKQGEGCSPCQCSTCTGCECACRCGKVAC